MTLEQRALKALQEIAKLYDTEAAHRAADNVLCDLLRALGYGKVVDAYEAIHKWYA